MLFSFFYAANSHYRGSQVWQLRGHAYHRVPAGMKFFLETIALLSGTGDMRMFREGGVRGARRLARHL
jgi:hypothetical protein